jgi:hypothetical protein
MSNSPKVQQNFNAPVYGVTGFPEVQQNFNAPVYGVTGKIAKDQTELKFDYIVRFIAWGLSDESDSVYKKLLTNDISVGITSELAEESGNLFSTHADIPSLNVYIAPEIFEKFLITNTGSNYTVQTVDVLRLLECWEAIGFSLYIDTTAFNFYKGWAIGSDMGTGIPKNL